MMRQPSSMAISFFSEDVNLSSVGRAIYRSISKDCMSCTRQAVLNSRGF